MSKANEAFLSSVRHHSELLETTPTHQIVMNAPGALDITYARSYAEAKEIVDTLSVLYPDRQASVYERGEFIPHN